MAELVENMAAPQAPRWYSPTPSNWRVALLIAAVAVPASVNRDQLVAILTYHVVPGKAMSGDIAGKAMQVATVQGQDLAINAQEGVRVNEATVIQADVEASNGVIHVIDTVLLPQ